MTDNPTESPLVNVLNRTGDLIFVPNPPGMSVRLMGAVMRGNESCPLAYVNRNAVPRDVLERWRDECASYLREKVYAVTDEEADAIEDRFLTCSGQKPRGGPYAP